MKTIVGTDLHPNGNAAIDLLARLKIPGNTLTLVHSIVPISPATSAGLVSMPLCPDFTEDLTQAAIESLQTGVHYAEGLGLPANYVLTLGAADRCLQEEAKALNADLIALCATPHGEVGSILTDSIARSLAISSSKSLLIVREPSRTSGPVTAIFATDHSEYCNEAMERLFSWDIKGLNKIVVYSAYETVGRESAVIGRHAAVRADEVQSWLKVQVQERTEAIAHRFRESGVASEVVVVHGDVNESLPKVIQDTGSELLILGARGHRFVERMMLGSVAVHQVTTGHIPMLIMRA